MRGSSFPNSRVPVTLPRSLLPPPRGTLAHCSAQRALLPEPSPPLHAEQRTRPASLVASSVATAAPVTCSLLIANLGTAVLIAMAGEATEQEMSILQQSADTVAGAVFSKEKGES